MTCLLLLCLHIVKLPLTDSFILKSLTLSSRVVMSRSADELLAAGAEGGEAWQQFVQLQSLGSVLCQLLPDLLHLCSHGGRLPKPLHRPLQSLQQWVHLVVKLRAKGDV